MSSWASVITNGRPEDLRQLLLSLGKDDLARFFRRTPTLGICPMQYFLDRMDIERAALLLSFGASLDEVYPEQATNLASARARAAGTDKYARVERSPLTTAISVAGAASWLPILVFVLDEARARGCLAAVMETAFPSREELPRRVPRRVPPCIQEVLTADFAPALVVLLEAGISPNGTVPATLSTSERLVHLAAMADAVECLRALRARVPDEEWIALLAEPTLGFDMHIFAVAKPAAIHFLVSCIDLEALDRLFPPSQREQLEQSLARVIAAERRPDGAAARGDAAASDADIAAARTALAGWDVQTQAEVFAAHLNGQFCRHVLWRATQSGLVRAVRALVALGCDPQHPQHALNPLLSVAPSAAVAEALFGTAADVSAERLFAAAVDICYRFDFHQPGDQRRRYFSEFSFRAMGVGAARYIVAAVAPYLATSTNLRGCVESYLQRMPYSCSVISLRTSADALLTARACLEALSAATADPAAASACASSADADPFFPLFKAASVKILDHLTETMLPSDVATFLDTASASPASAATFASFMKRSSRNIILAALHNGQFALAQLFVEFGANVLGTPKGVPSLLFSLVDKEFQRSPHQWTARDSLSASALPPCCDPSVEAGSERGFAADLDATAARAHAAAAAAEEERLLAALLQDPNYLPVRGHIMPWVRWVESVLPALGLRWVWDQMTRLDSGRARAALSELHSVNGSQGRLRTALSAAVDSRNIRAIRFLLSIGAPLSSLAETNVYVTAVCTQGRYEHVWAVLDRLHGAALAHPPPIGGAQVFDITVVRDKSGRNCAEMLARAVTCGHRFPRALLEELAARKVQLPRTAAQSWLANDCRAEISGEALRMLRWVLADIIPMVSGGITPE